MKLVAGKKISRWTLIKRVRKNKFLIYWLCRCSCGSRKLVYESSLRLRKSRSCGCIRDEATRARRLTHGQTVGKRPTKEYRAWGHAKARCLDAKAKDFRNYGGRGIKMSPAWMKSFRAFFRHVGKCPSATHSLDRIDNNRGYSPGNVRWATKSQQARNRRSHFGRSFDQFYEEGKRR